MVAMWCGVGGSHSSVGGSVSASLWCILPLNGVGEWATVTLVAPVVEPVLALDGLAGYCVVVESMV